MIPQLLFFGLLTGAGGTPATAAAAPSWSAPTLAAPAWVAPTWMTRP